jgi:hypothetical protein
VTLLCTTCPARACLPSLRPPHPPVPDLALQLTLAPLAPPPLVQVLLSVLLLISLLLILFPILLLLLLLFRVLALALPLVLVMVLALAPALTPAQAQALAQAQPLFLTLAPLAHRALLLGCLALLLILPP